MRVAGKTSRQRASFPRNFPLAGLTRSCSTMDSVPVSEADDVSSILAGSTSVIGSTFFGNGLGTKPPRKEKPGPLTETGS